VEGYGRRVARCIPAPRVVSDAAQGNMHGVPSGSAVVGSTPQERALAVQLSGRGSAPLFEHETARRVELVDAFRIDRTPVTNEAFSEFVGACGAPPPDRDTVTPAAWDDLTRRFGATLSFAEIQRFVWPNALPPPQREGHPVVLVTYDDAAFYCAWRGARLPSEIEWERAARGGQGQLFPWGQRFDPTKVNTREFGPGDTTEVGSFDLVSSPVGAKDMGGLVFEWTQTNAEGVPQTRVVKSNSWRQLGGLSRGAARTFRHEDIRDAELGFRCAAGVSAPSVGHGAEAQ